MTITGFLRALQAHNIKLIEDGGEYRDCDGDCPIVALHNAENPTTWLDNSDAEEAGRELGLQSDDVTDIIEISDGGKPGDFALRLKQRLRIRKALHAMAA